MSERVPTALRAIHAGILCGIVLFLIVAVWLMRGSEASGASWSWVWLVPAAIAVFGTGFVRGRLSQERDPGRRRSFALVTWGLAEAAAIAGLVVGLVTGSWAAVVGGGTVGVGLLLYYGPRTFA